MRWIAAQNGPPVSPAPHPGGVKRAPPSMWQAQQLARLAEALLVKAPDAQRWVVAHDLDGSPKVRTRCRQLVAGVRCRDFVEVICDRCSKPTCRAHSTPLVTLDAVPGQEPPEVCRACQALARHVGADLRTITAAQRRTFLQSSAAAGVAARSEADDYADLPTWPPPLRTPRS